MKKIISIFKALSDETRVRILHLLLKAQAGLCICEIMDSLQIAQYNISRHMKELRIAGLVTEKRDKKFVIYSFLEQKSPFYQYLKKTLSAMPAGLFADDDQRLRTRLSLRVKGRICVGLKGKKK